MQRIDFYLDFASAEARAAFDALPAQLMGASYAVRYLPLGAGALAAWERASALGTPNRYVCERLFAGETPPAPPGAASDQAAARLQRAEEGARAAGVQHLPALIVGGQTFTPPLDWSALRAALERAENTDTQEK
ncbi:MAG: hypothetical protein IJM64_05320 [Ottowia sp.]|nr:hypothetical protein [Ottowia sp.]